MPFSLNKNVFTFNQSGTHYQHGLHLPKPWPFVYDFSVGGECLQVIKRMLQNNSNDLNQLGIDSQKCTRQSYYLLVPPGSHRTLTVLKTEGGGHCCHEYLISGFVHMLCDVCTRARCMCEEQPPKRDRDPRALLLRTAGFGGARLTDELDLKGLFQPK